MTLVPPLEPPTDFDAYWAGTLAELDRIPFDVREEDAALGAYPTASAATAPPSSPAASRAVSGRPASQSPPATPGEPPVRVTRLTYASLGGVRPAGWLFRPRAVPAEGALLFLPGYSATCGAAVIQAVLAQLAEAGFAVLAVDPRGQGASRAAHVPAPEGKIVTGVLDPRAYIYRGIAADCVRAAQVLAALTGFAKVGVLGHSQGGGLSLLTASLAGELVGAVGCVIPFLTHMAAALAERALTGPYREVYDYARNHPEALPALRRSLGYIDTLNHAPRVAAPTLVSVGLRDTTCPPPTVYALFERLRCTRSLLVLPETGHEHVPAFYHHEVAWFRRFLRPEPPGGCTLENLGLLQS